MPDDVVGQLIARDTTTVRGFVESLRLAKRDPRITGVLLMPSSLESPYWGKVQELRDAVLDFRKSGKMVVAFLEYGGDREYYLASAADRVFLLPTSALDLTGVASYEVFLRGTFDKLGAYPDFLQIGAYKTAVNQLTQKAFTPAHREMTESLNGDMYEQLVRGIASARKKTEAETRQLLDQGPFSPEDAVRTGLVDALAYEDQLDDRVPQLRQGGEMRRVDGSDYQRVTPRSLGVRPVSRIAVLYASGVIASGKSGYDPGNGHGRRLGHLRRAAAPAARGRHDQGDRAARRQPRRIVGRVRRHVARADDHARSETVAAARSRRCRTWRRRAGTTSPCRLRSSSRSRGR